MALNSSDVSAGDQGLATQYNNLRADVVGHAARHVTSGEDEVDGDHLDIDFTPTNYTPATTPAEASDVDDLAAHLYGIDDAITSDALLQLLVTYLDTTLLQKFPATGDGTNPEYINDGSTPNKWVSNTVDQSATVDFGIVVKLDEYRHHGGGLNNNDGAFKIEYYNPFTAAWADWVTGISTRASSWSSWDNSGGAIYASQIRVTTTTVDSQGSSRIGEIEARMADG